MKNLTGNEMHSPHGNNDEVLDAKPRASVDVSHVEQELFPFGRCLMSPKMDALQQFLPLKRA